MSVLVKGRRGFSLVADEGVGEDEELSHDCDDGDFWGFTGRDHGLVFGLEFRVEADGAEGWHIEGASGSRASAADGSPAIGLAAVAGDGGETDEATGLGIVEAPELGRLNDEGVCGGLGEAWNAGEDIDAQRQVGV